MRISRDAVLLFLCALIPFSLSAQQSTSTAQPTPPVRDPQAVAIVQKAIGVTGGGAAGTILNAQVEGTLAPTAGSEVPSATFTWLDDFSGATFEFRYETDRADVTRIEVSGHGSPAGQQNTTVYPLRPHVMYTALPYHLPAVLLARELANADYSIQMGGSLTVEGGPAVQVIIKTNTDPLARALSEQRWYFDAASGLPLRIEYRLPSTVYPDEWMPGAVELSKYQVVSGVAVPFQITDFENGAATSIATISSVKFNVITASSMFDLSSGGAQ